MADANDVPHRDPRDIDWPLQFKLSKVVEAHGEQTQVLVLREPTGDEVLEHDLLEGLDQRQFFPLVVKLAGVPMSTLKKLPARDLLALGTVLSRFFVMAAQPPMPSTTP
ncbi:phage tail assembly protein [Methylobacterium gnaphalii]|uniref:Phage tail assembly protein n=1 Tax=Methylobacterium gnaphalii TaxID=1010610 RepID=A0A512JIM2_9HYPH|nr:phage tail assembly protein [Methylobacterium gnaphalii]GEP09809.1 hypothetical protein MGN01_16540 [Methylobacterium gnaphalii]GJD67276.1 hypothetical protein MMMDOFMJ_0190 [Methylobacterium gnaphalii]GLS49839.1 hypothetical protein GCM10007885_26910 [Methylobacterium gnaphalii]